METSMLVVGLALLIVLSPILVVLFAFELVFRNNSNK